MLAVLTGVAVATAILRMLVSAISLRVSKVNVQRFTSMLVGGPLLVGTIWTGFNLAQEAYYSYYLFPKFKEGYIMPMRWQDIDPCPKEKRCFFNWLDGPLGKAAQDLETTRTLMFAMAAKEGGWTQPALDHNMPLNNPFGVNKIRRGQAAGNIAYPSVSAAANAWIGLFGDRVRGTQNPEDFIHGLQHPDTGQPYNSVNPNYETDFEQVYKAVVKFMKLCGIHE